jgi:hypothetical protein
LKAFEGNHNQTRIIIMRKAKWDLCDMQTYLLLYPTGMHDISNNSSRIGRTYNTPSISAHSGCIGFLPVDVNPGQE